VNLAEYIEHTNLKPTLTDKDIDILVEETVQYNFKGICVPPFWVEKVRRDLDHHKSNAALVTVVGFPFGYSTTETKLRETEDALARGATEIDVVWNLSAFKSGMPWPKIELAKLADLIHKHEQSLKVIIETAFLTDEEIVEAARLCVSAGADFVKTSTGYAPTGATISAIALMRKSIPSNVGLKASGGIKSRDFALKLIEAGATRIGTSSGPQLLHE